MPPKLDHSAVTIQHLWPTFSIERLSVFVFLWKKIFDNMAIVHLWREIVELYKRSYVMS